MPSVTRRISPHPTVGELVVLSDETGDAEVVVAPQRGGIVTSFRVGSRELLYLDEETLADPGRSVRGGIPLLFPFPGRLKDDTLSSGGRSLKIGQHGFGRTLPWTVSETRITDGANVKLELRSSTATLDIYPWEFTVKYSVTLVGSLLLLGWTVWNQSAEPMPCALGFHPYFRVADKARARVEAPIARARDTFSGKEVTLESVDLTAPEVDVRFEPERSESTLHLGDGAHVGLQGSPDFRHWVVWSLGGKDFVCVEPWTARANALNDEQGPPPLAPGGARASMVTIAPSP